MIAPRHALLLAGRHLLFHRGRTALIVVALALVAGLPLVVRSLVASGTSAMMARARSSPLVVGSRGSELDLVIAALYFAKPAPRAIPAGEATRIAALTHGVVVPMHLGFAAQRHPLVGTTIDYLDLRGLRLADGRAFATLGECVLGATAARELRLAAGESLVTDATDPYNLAGTVPLRLHVVGVLAPTGTADDIAVLVDLKTAWTVAGIGHGHQAAETIRDPNDLVGTIRGEGGEHVVTSERLKHFEEITPESLAGFHFHGDPASFPIHALLTWPRDEKDATLFQGAFQRSDESLQVVKPTDAMERLLREILRVRRFLDAIFLAVGAVTIAVVGLVIALSIRLRREELQTMVRLGAARGTVASIIGAELLLIALLAAGLVAGGVLVSQSMQATVERLIVARS
jgi:putative ABC transport system permease protein